MFKPTPVPVSVPVVPGAPSPSEALPGLRGADVIVPPRLLVREGSFLNRRSGVVLTAPTGERIVVFAPAASGRDLPPMVLLPSPTLETIDETARATPGDTLDLVVSGQVLVYHSRNYLLPTLVALPAAGRPDQPPPPQQGDQPSDEPSADAPANAAAPPSPADDQRVLDLIAELQREADRPVVPARPLPTAAPEPTLQPAAEPVSDRVIPERALMRQRGRLVRSPNGPWVFSIDSDPDSPAPEPMIVLPGLALQRIEPVASRLGEPLVIEMSGRVLGYRGRAYIKPTMILVHRSFDLQTGQ